MDSLSKEIEETPLQIKLERVATLIGWLGAAVAIALFIVLVSGWAIQIIDRNLSFAEEVSTE